MSENNDPNNNPNNADPGGEQGGGEGGEKKFTQAEVDEMMKDRVKRVNQKFADYDDLKAKADKFDEIEEANKTELEKAREEADKAKREGQDAIDKANKRMLQAEFVAEASKAGVKNPEDAFLLADHAGVSISAEGKVEGVAAAVKALVEAGRLPLTSSKAPNLDGGAGDNDGDGNNSADDLTDEEKQAAAKMNVSLENYKKYKNKAGKTA